MPFHIKRTSSIPSVGTVYYKGSSHWSDNYANRKVYSSKTEADNTIVNTDGTNGQFANATVVSE